MYKKDYETSQTLPCRSAPPFPGIAPSRPAPLISVLVTFLELRSIEVRFGVSVRLQLLCVI